MADHTYFTTLIWQIADLLRGPYRPPQYERVMLPMTVLRRFDCVLASTKAAVLAEYARPEVSRLTGNALESRLNAAAGQYFHNKSPLDFQKLKGDPDNLHHNLESYIKGFSANVREIFEFFEFDAEIAKMHEANVLYLVISKFSDVDLHPRAVPNEEMGRIFENLIRRFNELANETAGDHFTPRDVIRLMVDLLLMRDDALLGTPGTVRKLLDPACGTGGMLAEAQRYMERHHKPANLFVYGQDYNKRAYATAASDILMKLKPVPSGRTARGADVRFGDVFTADRYPLGDPETGGHFDYFLANPPFGVDWKRQQKDIEKEHKRGALGRFGAGLPRVNDGSLLFLQHMVSKFEEVDPAQQKDGSRLAIVFSGSPLFAGGAGSGESEIRRWLIENDWLEAIIALPEQMFYNTGIGTYVWIVTNRKAPERRRKIQLFDAREVYLPMRRSLGDKRRKLGEGPTVAGEDRPDEPPHVDEIVRGYGALGECRLAEWRDARGNRVRLRVLAPTDPLPDAPEGGRVETRVISRVFDNDDFGYTRVTVERPLRLRYCMTVDDKARFLDACPHLLDDVQAIDRTLGREPRRDWDATWGEIQALLRTRGGRWTAAEQKLFRAVFTARDPEAEPVSKGGRGTGYEPDAELRDFENVPLKTDVDDYFAREVRPHVPDAWMDREKDKVGYEINFNRHFYQYVPPRPLADIDADLKVAEEEIVRLLREVTA